MTDESDEVRRLRDDLFQARVTVLRVMPEPIRRVLETYIQCTSLEELIDWQRSTAEQIVKLAEARPAKEMGERSNISDRAICPLCGEGTSWRGLPEVIGFTVPDGLIRHLRGAQRAMPCAVFAIACALARENLKLLSARKQASDELP